MVNGGPGQTVQRRTALVTGASSGIGEAFADVFATEGFDVVLVARREERLRAVAARLEQQHGVHAHVIVCDLSRREAVRTLVADLSARGVAVDALVNNAGYGIPGVFLASSWERHDAMLQVMLVSLCELTYALLPGMIARGYGRIINVASLAGLVPAPAGHTLYAAVKAFLIKFSESLSHETRANGVLVTAVCPGFTFSEFHDVSGMRDRVSRLPRWLWMDANTVARQGFDANMAGTLVYINGSINRLIASLVRFLPERLVVSIGKGFAGSYRKAE
jgi:short-subunit dehydrogenase